MKKIPDYPEKWRDIVGFPGYQVSTLGHIRSRLVWGQKNKFRRTWRIRKIGKIDRDGRSGIVLCRAGKKFSCTPHTLVLEAFVGHCPRGMECCHKDGHAWDNRLSQLRWDTHRNNMQDAKVHGTWAHGETMALRKLDDSRVRSIIRCSERGVAQRALAQRFGVSRVVISGIQKGTLWRHVTGRKYMGIRLQPRGEDARQAKLSNDDVLKVVDLLDQGATHKNIALMYGVDSTCISSISAGKNWSWLTGRGKDKKAS